MMMKVLFRITSVFFLTAAVAAQNCSGTSVGFVPLNDLAGGNHMGSQGGLYPGGLNQRPAAHEAAGLALAGQVAPLDAAGQPDPAGSIGLISVGMSNATQEFSTWVPTSDADPERAASVVVVDCAQGGVDAVDMSNPAHTYWVNTVPARLANGGLTPAQVQVAWVKNAIRATDPSMVGTFPADAMTLRDRMRDILQLAKSQFPNLRMCYLSSRIYAGYATTALNPEPWAYESGFAIKWLVEDQINGDPALNWDSTAGPVLAPWISWGPYTWADGLTPRSDGLTWLCSDFNPDGTHPSTAGRQKVAAMLDTHFRNDTTTMPWYRDGNVGGLPAAVNLYGTGCPGAQGVPSMVTNSAPWLGNPNFAIGVSHGAPASWAILFVSTASAQEPFFGCTLWIEGQSLLLPSATVSTVVSLNGVGNGFIANPVPNDPFLDQVMVYGQWIIGDPLGAVPILGGLSMTRGAELRFGPQ